MNDAQLEKMSEEIFDVIDDKLSCDKQITAIKEVLIDWF